MAPNEEALEYWILQRRLLPHANQCLKGLRHDFDQRLGSRYFDLLHNLAVLYENQHQYADAENICALAYAGKSALVGRSYQTVRVSRDLLAEVYMHPHKADIFDLLLEDYHGHTSDMNGSAIMFEPTVQFCKPDMTFGAMAIDRHGLDALRLKYLRESGGMALKHYRESQKNMIIGVAWLRMGLFIARTLQDLKQYDLAEELYKSILQQFDKGLIPEDSHAMIVLANLGLLYLIWQKYDLAEETLLGALKKQPSFDGPYHMYTNIVLNWLGRLYAAAYRYDEAERMFIEGICGPHFVSRQSGIDLILNLAFGLAFVYHQQGRLDRASHVIRGALKLSGCWVMPENMLDFDSQASAILRANLRRRITTAVGDRVSWKEV